MLEHSTYSVASPEACASIVWRDSTKADLAAEAMKLNAESVYDLGLIDEVIPEPLGGAHRSFDQASSNLFKVLIKNLDDLTNMSIDSLLDRRYKRLMSYGSIVMARLTLNNEILNDFNKLGIAFSGGLDSSVLLKLISEQDIQKDRITALHVNHGINNDSDKWEEFCAQIAAGLGVNFKSWKLKDLDKITEDILRNRRHEVFRKLGRSQ